MNWRNGRGFQQSRPALEAIPRGNRKDYKLYWTQQLEELEEQVTVARVNEEENKSTEVNIAYKAISAQYRKTLTHQSGTVGLKRPNPLTWTKMAESYRDSQKS
jgi:hypothetical protein